MNRLLLERLERVGELSRLVSERQRLARVLSGLEIDAEGGADVEAQRSAAEESLSACDREIDRIEQHLDRLDKELAAGTPPGRERT